MNCVICIQLTGPDYSAATMDNVVVVIPIHSSEPSALELVSFRQCFRVFSKRPIVIICPVGLNLTGYRNACDGAEFTVYQLHKDWFCSKSMYNKLKLSYYFYDLFKSYTFLLTYELDAFAFCDNLDYWCSLEFDYIGAPWFNNFGVDSFILDRVGNSGFSLRRIHAIRKVLPFIFVNNSPSRDSGKLSSIWFRVRWVFNYVRTIFGENPSIQNAGNIYEDFLLTQKFIVASPLRLPDVIHASFFSFEVHPSLLYQINGEVLPMGCHAWWTYDLDFWRPFINKFGYSV